MALPLAYFLTWTCYGQRLHGDDRGSVDLVHNTPGTPPLPPDPARCAFERSRLLGDPVELNAAMRGIVDLSVVSLCEDRDWKCLARNVRSTHVHVVVNCRGTSSPERALAQFKAWATRDLRRAGMAAPDARLWTTHGSTRWINFDTGLIGAIAYVEDWQCGPNREFLEEHRSAANERLAEMRQWLRANGLPVDGRTVMVGENKAERHLRVYEPRTQ